MDILSRLLAPIVSESLGQPIVVENRPGATGTVAITAVASSPADGYTLMFTGSSYAIITMLMRNLPFRMDDFTPLSRLTVGPTLLAVPGQLGVKTVAEFVAAAKARPHVAHCSASRHRVRAKRSSSTRRSHSRMASASIGSRW